MTTNLAPQNIWIEIRKDGGRQRYFVDLKKGSEISCFVLQDWMEAAMEFIAGCDNRGCGKVKYERKIRNADLRDGMVTLCSLRTNDETRVVEMNIVGVWVGCSPFDVHICKFEMEQWLNACDIDLAAHRLASEDFENRHRFEHVYKERELAERVIESVVFR